MEGCEGGPSLDESLRREKDRSVSPSDTLHCGGGTFHSKDEVFLMVLGWSSVSIKR